MKHLILLCAFLTLGISTAMAESIYDIDVNYCIKADQVQTAAELLEALAFLTYSENQSNDCTGRTHIDFVTASSFKPKEFSGQVLVAVTASCAEAQTRLLARIEGDPRFQQGSMGWCLH